MFIVEILENGQIIQASEIENPDKIYAAYLESGSVELLYHQEYDVVELLEDNSLHNCGSELYERFLKLSNNEAMDLQSGGFAQHIMSRNAIRDVLYDIDVDFINSCRIASNMETIEKELPPARNRKSIIRSKMG